MAEILRVKFLVKFAPRMVGGHCPFESSTSYTITHATSSAIRWWMIRDGSHYAMLVLLLVPTLVLSASAAPSASAR